MFTLSAALQESKNAVQQLQQQLSDQEAALAAEGAADPAGVLT